MTVETFRFRYFEGWLAVSLSLFLLLTSVVYMTTQAAGTSHLTAVVVAVGAGSLFSELTAPVLEWFTDPAERDETNASTDDREVIH